MGLFIKQTEQRSQLQSKIAADLANRVQSMQGGDGAKKGVKMNDDPAQAATGRSMFWVGVVAMLVVALVVFVLFVSEAI
jgi:hypothetical protein